MTTRVTCDHSSYWITIYGNCMACENDDLRAQLATRTAERDAFQSGQLEIARALGYQEGESVSRHSFILRQLAASHDRRATLEEALNEISHMLTEINPNNYDQDDVEAQNSSVIGAIKYAISFLPTNKPALEPKEP